MGKKDGKGTYIFNQTGMKFVGNFKGGQICEGKWLYPNGSYFEGLFENNMPKAQGQWHFGNGNVVEGVYTQTKKVEVSDGNPSHLRSDLQRLKMILTSNKLNTNLIFNSGKIKIELTILNKI